MDQIKKMTWKEPGEKTKTKTKKTLKSGLGDCIWESAQAHHFILKECYSLTFKSNRFTFK